MHARFPYGRGPALPRLAAIGIVSLLWACSGPPEPAGRTNAPDAPLPLAGAHNLRDLGGHPAADGLRIKDGVVYRSDALSHLTDADLRRVADLDLRTVVDFRIDQELELEGPDRLPEGQDIRRVSLPINPVDSAGYLERLLAGQVEKAAEATEYMTALYATMVLDHAPEYRTLVDAVLEPGATPLLFHCTAGKDRAGIASALLLRLVGAPMEVIEANYLASPLVELRGIGLLTGVGPTCLPSLPLHSRNSGIRIFRARAARPSVKKSTNTGLAKPLTPTRCSECGGGLDATGFFLQGTVACARLRVGLWGRRPRQAGHR